MNQPNNTDAPRSEKAAAARSNIWPVTSHDMASGASSPDPTPDSVFMIGNFLFFLSSHECCPVAQGEAIKEGGKFPQAASLVSLSCCCWTMIPRDPRLVARSSLGNRGGEGRKE